MSGQLEQQVPPSSSTCRMNNEYGNSSYSCMPYPMQSSTNSELRASALPYTYPESGSEQYGSMGPNEYYYDPSCYYIPYLPEHSVSSSHVNTSDYSGDWYHNPLPSHSQQWYSASETPSSSYYPPVTSDFGPYYYSSPYVHGDPESSTACITSWEDWPLASTSHSPNSDNTSSLYCPIQSDSSNFYTWCQSEHTQEKPFEDKVNTALSEHEHPEHSGQQTAGKSTEGMIGFEQVYSSWKDKVSTIIGMEHSPTVPTCLSFEDISTISCQKDFESKAYGPPSSQLQRSVELADPKSGQMASCPANAQAYISAANPLSLSLDSLLSRSSTFISDFHESGNPTVLSPSVFMEIPSGNLHESDCKTQVSNCINSPFLNMGTTSTNQSTVEGSCTKYPESSAVCNSNRAKKAVHYPASTNPSSHIWGCDTNPLSSSTISYCNDPSKAMNQSVGLPSTVDGLLSDDISCFLETVHHSQRLESSKEANILKSEDDPLKIPKSNELGLGYSVQGTAANHSQFSPVVDILSSDYHPPTPKRLFPLSSRENTPVVSIAQLVQRSTRPTNLSSNPLLHSSLINFAVSEPEFLKESTEYQKLECCQLPTLSFNETAAVECCQGFTPTDASSLSESSILTNDSSVFSETAVVDSRKDCDKLVQTMHNLSVILLASLSSDNLRDPDIQALQSVICNLSEYLVKKMELPISNVGDASKPEMSSVSGNLRSTQKVCKSDRCSCKMEDVDFSRKESTKVAACSASSCKGISVGKTNTQISAEPVWSHMEDTVEKGSTSIKFSQSGQVKCSETRHGKLQNLFENLKQDFRSELKERDERIHLYKSLWSDAEAAVDSMLFEMKLTKMEFEMEKLKRNRGTLEFGNIDSETFANKEAVNSGNCLPVNLEIKGNDIDYTAIQTLKEKKGLADLNLNPVMDNASETDANGIIQKNGGVLLSKNRSDHIAVQTLKEKNGLADLNLTPLMDNALETDANGIIQKHGGTLLAKNKTDHTAVQTLKEQNGLADLNLIPVIDNALETDVNGIIQKHGGMHLSKSKSDHTAVQTLKDKNGLADLNLNPVMDNALETDTNGIIQNHRGMHLSKNTSYPTAVQTLKEKSWLADLNLNPVLDNALGTDANGIIQKHGGMLHSKNKIDHTAVQTLKEKIWLADLNLNPVMDNALETDVNGIIQKHGGMLFSKNKSDHTAIHTLKRKNGLADLNFNPVMDDALEMDENGTIKKHGVMLLSMDKSHRPAILNSSLIISDQNTWKPHASKDTKQMEGILTELGILEEYGGSFDLKKLDLSKPLVNDVLEKKPIDESDPLSRKLNMGLRIDSSEGKWQYTDQSLLLDPEANSWLKSCDKPLPCALGSVKIEADYAEGYDNLFGKQRIPCTLQEYESGSFFAEGNQLKSSTSVGPCDFSSSIFMGTSISNTWKPSDDEVKYLLPSVRTGSISSSLAENFHIEREKCVDVEDLNEVLSSKYSEIEMLVSKESNFFMDTLGQTSNILLDKGSKVESPKEYKFVCCQNELENAIAMPTSGEASESESSWEQVNEEDF